MVAFCDHFSCLCEQNSVSGRAGMTTTMLPNIKMTNVMKAEQNCATHLCFTDCLSVRTNVSAAAKADLDHVTLLLHSARRSSKESI